MNVQQDLCSQGTVRPGKRDRPGRRARPFSVSPGQPSPAGKRPTNCIGLTSFLADKLVKIDVSVIVMISRAAAKGPTEPHVGTKRGHSVSAIFPWTFPRVGASVLPTRGAISSLRILMREFRCFIVLIKKNAEEPSLSFVFFQAILELTPLFLISYLLSHYIF